MAEEPGRIETERTVVLADRYEILPRQPLPALASPAAPAFAVRDSREPSRRLFALLCSGDLPFREETLMALRRLNRPQLLRPVEWAVIDWPGAPEPASGPGRRPAILFEAPGGGRLMSSLSAASPPMSEEALTRRVLGPVAGALKDLAAMGLSHGAIRPDNLFLGGQPDGEIVLGEGCSAPPGLAQPTLFLTIGAGMAGPGGQGPAGIADDLYALGVTLVILALGRDPLAALDGPAIVAAKITQGSYAALAGQARLGAALAEALRGLLADDPEHRWGFDQLEAWLDGRRLSPSPPNLPPRAGRPFRFEGVEHWTRPALAHAMAQNWERTVAAIQPEPIEHWLRRSLGDTSRANRLAAAAALRETEGGTLAGHLLLARMLMIVDPSAPIRYRGFSARVEGLGLALAAGFDRPGMAQLFAETIVNRLPQAWIDLQGDRPVDLLPMRKILDMLHYFLERPGPGNSVERCLYELNPGLPCRSPLLEHEYVAKIDALLPALNRVAVAVDRDREPVDRHVAAFIAARAKHLSERDFAGLGPESDLPRRRLAMLRILAAVEQQYGATAELAALRAWLAALAQPIVESFHHRPFKTALAREIARVADAGTITDFAQLLDNDDLRRRDREGFARARARYATARREEAWLEADGPLAKDRLARLADRAAAMTSGVAAGLFLVSLAMIVML